MNSYLQLRDISKSFGSLHVLKNINLNIQKGELVCFLGPSGCGKTTLLRIIAGLEKQTTGTVYQAGEDISFASPAKRDYGIVFQSYALFPNLTVKENVIYGLNARKNDPYYIEKRAQDLLYMVGLQASESKYPAQISGGQQQRVALARALATSPGLLLLDEPLSALDATVRLHLRNEIRSLQRKLGVTTIMVTHDQEEALSMADRIVVINQGQVEQEGSPMDIYCHPASAFVANFVGKVNCLNAVALSHNEFKCGDMQFCISKVNNRLKDFKPGDRAKIYLRPEDGLIGERMSKDPESCIATVQRIEFLGGNCLAEVTVDRIPEQKLQFQFSLHQIREFRVQEGTRIPLKIRSEQLQIFAE